MAEVLTGFTMVRCWGCEYEYLKRGQKAADILSFVVIEPKQVLQVAACPDCRADPCLPDAIKESYQHHMEGCPSVILHAGLTPLVTYLEVQKDRAKRGAVLGDTIYELEKAEKAVAAQLTAIRKAVASLRKLSKEQK